MELIDKDALVAKIIEHIKTYNKGYANGDDRRADALENLLHDLNTLEVKEVDLEKIIEQTYHDRSVTDTSDMDHVSYENIARHFFELGLKAAQKGK